MMRWQAIPKVTGGKWRATWEHLGVRAIFKNPPQDHESHFHLGGGNSKIFDFHYYLAK